MASGLEQAGEITLSAAKERAEEAYSNLQEAVRILSFEPEMKEVLEDRTKLVSSVLGKYLGLRRFQI